ncbi:MAG: ABC transporter permease [Bacteroidetes bacterium]|nr:ABC transporter permease [Bacteroidota bacterium]
MFKNYFTIAIRNFWRNRVFAFINMAGLSIGISAALVIYLIVHYEFSFEKFQKDGGRIYRIVTNMHFPDNDFKNSGVPGPLPNAVRNEIPGIEESSAFWTADQTKVTIIENGETKVFKKQQRIIYADDHYFKLFPYKWLAGSPGNALNEPNQVVLTESRVKTYFPSVDISKAIGQTIIYNDTVKAALVGIVKDMDEITDFTFQEFISLPTYSEQLKHNNGWDEWGSVNSASQFFIKFKNKPDTAKSNKELAAVRKKHEKDAYLSTEHLLQPLSDIHFNADFDAFDQKKAHKPTLYGLIVIALFLLLLGCINFINLTTAQAAQRAKEIGIRKTMGSSRRNLVIQFLSETLLLTVCAAIISIILTPFILKLFSNFIPEGLHFDLLRQPHILIFIFLLVLVVSFLSGFYPAMVLSGYKPVLVLKNLAYANTSKSRRIWIRKTLTVSQFVIAQFFIIATIIVSKQIRFALNKDMGFRKNAIINFNAPYNYQHPDDKQFVLQQKLQAIPGIEKLSLAGEPPASISLAISTMKFNKDGKEIEATVQVKQADTNYFDLYRMKIIAGRNLQQSDTVREYLANEAYAKFLGYQNPADLVGKMINQGKNKIPIVGVLADFNTNSLHSKVGPLVYTCQARSHHTFSVLLSSNGKNTDGWKKTISQITSVWKEVYPEDDFSYTFFDKSIEAFYKTEQQTAQLMNWAAALSIIIGCLGLLGLVIYTTTQRTKEIGVRKVLGASVTQIVSLLSKDFIRLVIIAFIIVTPLAWWAMNKWLEDFAYRTTISWWVFAVTGFVMILIALLTLSIQTIRSATVNPVESLRTE